jgi:hypothetical protein
MKKIVTIVTLVYVLISSCTVQPGSLSDQLKISFLLHLEKIDSAAHLDSFGLIRKDTIDQRMERAIDDTFYIREFTRVQAQLANAIKEKKVDSIEFYQGEVDYMTPQVDSLTKIISKADTTRKLGLVAICSFQISKNHSSQQGMVFYFLDRDMKVMDSDFIDSAIAAPARKLK